MVEGPGEGGTMSSWDRGWAWQSGAAGFVSFCSAQQEKTSLRFKSHSDVLERGRKQRGSKSGHRMESEPVPRPSPGCPNLLLSSLQKEKKKQL